MPTIAAPTCLNHGMPFFSPHFARISLAEQKIEKKRSKDRIGRFGRDLFLLRAILARLARGIFVPRIERSRGGRGEERRKSAQQGQQRAERQEEGLRIVSLACAVE